MCEKQERRLSSEANVFRLLPKNPTCFSFNWIPPERKRPPRLFSHRRASCNPRQVERTISLSIPSKRGNSFEAIRERERERRRKRIARGSLTRIIPCSRVEVVACVVASPFHRCCYTSDNWPQLSVVARKRERENDARQGSRLHGKWNSARPRRRVLAITILIFPGECEREELTRR